MRCELSVFVLVRVVFVVAVLALSFCRDELSVLVVVVGVLVFVVFVLLLLSTSLTGMLVLVVADELAFALELPMLSPAPAEPVDDGIVDWANAPPALRATNAQVVKRS